MANGRYFLVLELVERVGPGESSSGARASNMVWPTALSLVPGAEVCRRWRSARQVARRQPLGIVHRDVSPNTFISEQGEVKLADFGIAKAQQNARRRPPGSSRGKVSVHVAGAGGGRRGWIDGRIVLGRFDAVPDGHQTSCRSRRHRSGVHCCGCSAPSTRRPRKQADRR